MLKHRHHALAGGSPGGVTLTGDAQPSTIRLLSYNIQTGIATNRYHQYVTHSWKHVLPCPGRRDNLDRIATLAQGYDFVALQEADAGSLRSGYVNITEYLAQRAGFPHWYDQTNRNFGTFAQHSMGALSQMRATEIAEHRLPGAISGRGALFIRYGRGDDSLVMLIVHLALGRRARLRQLRMVGDLAAEYRHVIVMGDLNCSSSSPELAWMIHRAGLSEPQHGLYTFPSWRPVRNIDHILVSPTLTVRSATVLDHPLSDHLPIAMEIELPKSITLDPPPRTGWAHQPARLAVS